MTKTEALIEAQAKHIRASKYPLGYSDGYNLAVELNNIGKEHGLMFVITEQRQSLEHYPDYETKHRIEPLEVE